MKSKRNHTTKKRIVATDIFCGVGGLTRGLLDAGIEVVAGYDIDEACKYPYEKNNYPAIFKRESVTELSGGELSALYPDDCLKVLVGCAPCQPFSKYTQGNDNSKDEKWGLLYQFGRLIEELKPDVLSMENVPDLKRHDVFKDFIGLLAKNKYKVSVYEVYCPDYGIPQNRTRLVLFASLLGPIEIIPPTHSKDRYKTVKDAIGGLLPIKAGGIHPKDKLHKSVRLEEINIKRIQSSIPGGTWRDWPESLIANCHKDEKGKTYSSVYGRMKWDEPSPTITTQFYGFGNGRFGHPEQDRAISLREGAILQSFPKYYRFVEPRKELSFKEIGRMIGNAVPVRLGKIVGLSILNHMGKNG
ncbi:MAG: DNA cytosine methyltransferase [Bacteroidota bacterium]|nr:DNA cytosine methyltransferase [Bacteroidota bacterium]